MMANVQGRIAPTTCPIRRKVCVKSSPSSGTGRRRRGWVVPVPGVFRLAEAIFGSVSRGGCLSLPPGQTLRTAARPASASCVLSSILHRDIRSPAGRSSFTTDLHAKKNQKDPPQISAQSSRYVHPFLPTTSTSSRPCLAQNEQILNSNCIQNVDPAIVKVSLGKGPAADHCPSPITTFRITRAESGPSATDTLTTTEYIRPGCLIQGWCTKPDEHCEVRCVELSTRYHARPY